MQIISVYIRICEKCVETLETAALWTSFFRATTTDKKNIRMYTGHISKFLYFSYLNNSFNHKPNVDIVSDFGFVELFEKVFTREQVDA